MGFKCKKAISNPVKSVDYTDKENLKNYLVTRELKTKVKKTGDGEEDFVTYEEVVITEKINRKEYIDSFASECGIENIAKKFMLTRDPSVFNQRKNVYPEGVVDLTKMPEDYISAQNMVNDQKAVLNSLPEDLQKLVLNGSKEDIIAYYEKKAAEKAANTTGGAVNE